MITKGIFVLCGLGVAGLLISYSTGFWFFSRQFLIIGIILIPFAYLWLTAKEKIKNLELHVTSLTLLITVMLFVLQGLQTVDSNAAAILAVTRANCGLARRHVEDIANDLKASHIALRTRGRYQTDIYRNNLPLLMHGQKADDNRLFETLDDLEQANRLLDLLQATGSQSILDFAQTAGGKDVETFLRHNSVFQQEMRSTDSAIAELAVRIRPELESLELRLAGSASSECGPP